jgi:hypothetical protein
MFPYREFVDEGGLVAYAVEVRELWRRAADCVNKTVTRSEGQRRSVLSGFKFSVDRQQ